MSPESCSLLAEPAPGLGARAKQGAPTRQRLPGVRGSFTPSQHAQLRTPQPGARFPLTSRALGLPLAPSGARCENPWAARQTQHPEDKSLPQGRLEPWQAPLLPVAWPPERSSTRHSAASLGSARSVSEAPHPPGRGREMAACWEAGLLSYQQGSLGTPLTLPPRPGHTRLRVGKRGSCEPHSGEPHLPLSGGFCGLGRNGNTFDVVETRKTPEPRKRAQALAADGACRVGTRQNELDTKAGHWPRS